MHANAPVLIDRDGEVLVLTLNRPSAANAMSQAMQDALVAALDAAEDDPGIRATLITAAGERVFSAGADLKEFADRPRREAGTLRRELLVRSLARMLDHPKPIVCAVRGRAIGGGWMLALTADEIIAGDAASFNLPEIGHGMPTPIGAALLSTRVQRAQCHRLVQTGATIDAAQALAHGLVDQVIPASELHVAALARARSLGALDDVAYAVNKRWLNRTVGLDLDRASVIAAQASATQAREGPT